MSPESKTTVAELIKRVTQMQESASARTVFGEPVQLNGRTIIPIAKVSYGFGLGMGAGGDKEHGATGEGGGGGGGASIRPVAVLEVSGESTKLKPVVDVTRLALAGMLLVAWNVFWVTYTVRKTAGKRA
jgi:uncharacterized spore protein YtfJ